MAARPGKDGLMLYVEPDLKESLRKLAAEDGRSMSNFIVRILDLYVKEHQELLDAGTKVDG